MGQDRLTNVSILHIVKYMTNLINIIIRLLTNLQNKTVVQIYKIINICTIYSTAQKY